MHVYKHTYFNILLLLHIAFMLCILKILLKGEVGVSAFNSHGNYTVAHGIVFLNFCGNPAYRFLKDVSITRGGAQQ